MIVTTKQIRESECDHVCFPISTGKKTWRYLRVSKEDFLEYMKKQHFTRVDIDNDLDDVERGFTLWVSFVNIEEKR